MFELSFNQWRTERGWGDTLPKGGKVKFTVNDIQKVKIMVNDLKKGRRKFWQWKEGGTHGKRAKK